MIATDDIAYMLTTDLQTQLLFDIRTCLWCICASVICAFTWWLIHHFKGGN